MEKVEKKVDVIPGLEILREAERQFTICNACRYCEGLCAAFQALEKHRDFDRGTVFYLANLCHDCRACFSACMFTAPHEFAINIPLVMSEARLTSYEQWSWPGLLGKSFRDRRLAIGLSVSVVLFVVAAALVWNGPNILATHVAPGSFYEVIPYLAMVVPAVILCFYGAAVWLRGSFQFWSETGKGEESEIDLKALAEAVGAALSLRYLGGGGPGCSYPEERPSMARRTYHSLVFWGFLADFVSTTLAFLFQDVFHRLPPYPLVSAPVLFGALGGIAIVIGAGGLASLKLKSDRGQAAKQAYIMDSEFLVILGLTALTGLLTLGFRATPALGILLAVHLGLVAALFLTAPYGKFIHAVYRSLALIKFYAEQNRPHQGA